MYLDNTKVYITRLAENEFHFSYEYRGRKEEILCLKQFDFEGQTYKVKRIVEAFDVVGYHSFLVYAEPIR